MQRLLNAERAWALRKNDPTIPTNLSIAYHYSGDYQKRDHYYREAERLEYHRLQDMKDIFEGKTGLR